MANGSRDSDADRIRRLADDVRAAAVRDWLAFNSPNVNLRRSIAEAGLFEPDELSSLLAA